MGRALFNRLAMERQIPGDHIDRLHQKVGAAHGWVDDFQRQYGFCPISARTEQRLQTPAHDMIDNRIRRKIAARSLFLAVLIAKYKWPSTWRVQRHAVIAR